MTRAKVQETETLLIETLLSALDARESARQGGSTMLVYLADMLAHRAHEELDALRHQAAADAGTSYAGSSPQPS